jgi:hypothetical protein
MKVRIFRGELTHSWAQAAAREHSGLSNVSFGITLADVSGSSPGPSSGSEVFVPGRQDGFGQNPVYRSAYLIWAHRSHFNSEPSSGAARARQVRRTPSQVPKPCGVPQTADSDSVSDPKCGTKAFEGLMACRTAGEAAEKTSADAAALVSRRMGACSRS